MSSKAQRSFFDQKSVIRKGRARPFKKTKVVHQTLGHAHATTHRTTKSHCTIPIEVDSELLHYETAADIMAHSHTDNTEMTECLLPDSAQCNMKPSLGSKEVRTKPISQKSPERMARTVPQTPATRLPLADLIGANGDLIKQGSYVEKTPDEKVLWAHSRSPRSAERTDSLIKALAPIRRGKKRARSSSPLSSPRETAYVRTSNMAFDLHHLNKVLKTPKVDPSKDIWAALDIDASGNSGSNVKLPPHFAHLIDPSSPRAPTNLRALNHGPGLARSVSCGTDWPISDAKRRKIAAPNHHEAVDDTFSSHRSNLQPLRKTKLSRVNLLMDRVQNSLINSSPPHDIAGLSSSSPLPNQNETKLGPTSSPLRNKLMNNQNVKPSGNLRQAITEAGSPSFQKRGAIPDTPHCSTNISDRSSEFGDIDDEEMIEAFNCVIKDSEVQRVSTMLLHSSPDRQKGQHTASFHLSSPSSAVVRKPPCFPKPGSNTAIENSHNNFNNNDDNHDDGDKDGDDEDGLYGSEFEEVMAKYDTHQSSLEDKQDMPMERVTSQIRTSQSPLRLSKPEGARDKLATNADRDRCEAEYGSFEEEDGDDIEFLAAEASAADSSILNPRERHCRQKPRAIKRYLVTSIANGEYQCHTGQVLPEVVLAVTQEATKVSKTIVLRQSWAETTCSVGAYVHLIGDFTRNGHCIIDDATNMLILHPDHLISSTVVADSLGCTRRAVLQDRVKTTNEPSPSQVYGQILHEIFQNAMRFNRWDTEWLGGVIVSIVERFLEDLYAVKVSTDHATDYLKSKMPKLQAWAKVFVSARPTSSAVIKGRNGRETTMSINKLLEVEEHVLSPMFGLKGNIDATVQVTEKDDDGQKTLTVPFEVKTGKNVTNASHRAQTALYTLLLSDRYDIEVVYGILYYMETSEMSQIPAIWHELRDMVIQRNRIACYVKDRSKLPPMLRSPYTCERCYAKVPCFVYHKLIEGGDEDSSGAKGKFTEVVRHLEPQHQAFFQKWDELLTKEERELLKFRRELWTMLSSEREKVGRCFANVILEHGSAHEEKDAPKINRFRYTLMKKDSLPNFSFLESQITVGEPIVISDEQGHFALANGYVTHLRKSRVTVAVDRRLHGARTRGQNFDATRNQVFAGIMEVVEEGALRSTFEPKESEEPPVYRLDKDEFSNGMAAVRNNLIQVMAEGRFGSRQIRSLVVDLKAPTFKVKSPAYDISSQANLNMDQRRAVEKVMAAQNYALVLGMPGTGKTTTITHIIRALVSQGKSILLTSYTHTAVDNILLKIRQDNTRILRIGPVTKIHPQVQEFVTLAGTPKKSTEELQQAYHSPQVVATTCLGINHQVFQERIFDYCIVDEASQITLPVCLGPIRMARTFILVGDHYQLPPLVQDKEARERGLDVSLFKLLSETHPSSVVNLEHQYRMNAAIMSLSNSLIYKGLLKCGNNEVARRKLHIPHLAGLVSHHHAFSTVSQGQKNVCVGPILGSCWIRDLLDPDLQACFVNTDALLPVARENAKGSRIVNEVEATICTQLVLALLSTGVPGKDIGVISIYRSQLSLLRRKLWGDKARDVEMHTADKYQGRDKEVIILSLVRSNDAKDIGELLKDWRRVNVALTRARTKLLILGSKQTLSGGNETLTKLVSMMEANGWLYDLPEKAIAKHRFEDVATQETDRSPLSMAVKALDFKNVDKENNPIPSPTKSQPRRGTINIKRVLGKRSVLGDIFNDIVG